MSDYKTKHKISQQEEMLLFDKVQEEVKREPGQRARAIARKLQEDKSDVNHIFYMKENQDVFWQDDNWGWHLFSELDNENDREYRSYCEARRRQEIHLNRIMGSLVGGAIGDALGYAVEFNSEREIFSRYGKYGISEYELDSNTGKALISDDTQMTLFTANAILTGETRRIVRGIGGPPSMYVGSFYEEWLKTQNMTYEEYQSAGNAECSHQKSWLMNIPEMFASRAPGMTCLHAISNGMGTVDKPVNDSKGCGGIMRVAPLGLRYGYLDSEKLVREGAEIAARTHGHSLGYMPAGMLACIVGKLAYWDGKSTFLDIIEDAKAATIECFGGDEHLETLINLVDLAIELARNDDDDLTNIHRLGEGWVAEETLAIALYCSFKYHDMFEKAIEVSVNHNGDSDSTGAVTGNIMGAMTGYKFIDNRWKENLELIDVIEEMAIDLCHGCCMSSLGGYDDVKWREKYIGSKRTAPSRALTEHWY